MYQRRYETLVLVTPELAEEGLDQFKQKLFDILEKDHGRLIQEENWGRRRLAYPVKKQMYGVYWLLDYMGSPELLAELERNLRIDERVFKYMTQVLDKHFTEEKYEKALEQLKLEKARQEAESADAEKRGSDYDDDSDRFGSDRDSDDDDGSDDDQSDDSDDDDD